MIAGFRHKGLKQLYERNNPKGINAEHVEKVRDILTTLDSAMVIADMDLPTFHLHELKGDRAGEWSVTVRANWRITFTFDNGEADHVNYEDYH